MAVKMNPFIFYLIFVAFIEGDAAVMMQATQATLDVQLQLDQSKEQKEN